MVCDLLPALGKIHYRGASGAQYRRQNLPENLHNVLGFTVFLPNPYSYVEVHEIERKRESKDSVNVLTLRGADRTSCHGNGNSRD